MKVKAGIIYNAIQVIDELSEKPMKVALIAKLLRLSDELQKENQLIEKQRREILEKYAKKDENGQLIRDKNGNVDFESENIEKVQNELYELSELEIDVTDREITQEELESNNLELTINQFVILNNFIHK